MTIRAGVFAVATFLLLAATPLAGQEHRSATAVENERIRALSNLSFWMGALVGERSGTVVVAMPVMPVEGVDLRGGDVIQQVNGTAVSDVASLNRAFDAIRAGHPVRLTLRRGGQVAVLRFAKPARPVRGTVQTRPVSR